jgi:hypothetical protein
VGDVYNWSVFRYLPANRPLSDIRDSDVLWMYHVPEAPGAAEVKAARKSAAAEAPKSYYAPVAKAENEQDVVVCLTRREVRVPPYPPPPFLFPRPPPCLSPLPVPTASIPPLPFLSLLTPSSSPPTTSFSPLLFVSRNFAAPRYSVPGILPSRQPVPIRGRCRPPHRQLAVLLRRVRYAAHWQAGTIARCRVCSPPALVWPPAPLGTVPPVVCACPAARDCVAARAAVREAGGGC